MGIEKSSTKNVKPPKKKKNSMCKRLTVQPKTENTLTPFHVSDTYKNFLTRSKYTNRFPVNFKT